MSRHLLSQLELGLLEIGPSSRSLCLALDESLPIPRVTFFSLSDRMKTCQPFHLPLHTALSAGQKSIAKDSYEASVNDVEAPQKKDAVSIDVRHLL